MFTAGVTLDTKPSPMGECVRMSRSYAKKDTLEAQGGDVPHAFQPFGVPEVGSIRKVFNVINCEGSEKIFPSLGPILTEMSSEGGLIGRMCVASVGCSSFACENVGSSVTRDVLMTRDPIEDQSCFCDRINGPYRLNNFFKCSINFTHTEL